MCAFFGSSAASSAAACAASCASRAARRQRLHRRRAAACSKLRRVQVSFIGVHDQTTWRITSGWNTREPTRFQVAAIDRPSRQFVPSAASEYSYGVRYCPGASWSLIGAARRRTPGWRCAHCPPRCSARSGGSANPRPRLEFDAHASLIDSDGFARASVNSSPSFTGARAGGIVAAQSARRKLMTTEQQHTHDAQCAAGRATPGKIQNGSGITEPVSPGLRLTETTVAFGKKLNSDALAQV